MSAALHIVKPTDLTAAEFKEILDEAKKVAAVIAGATGEVESETLRESRLLHTMRHAGADFWPGTRDSDFLYWAIDQGLVKAPTVGRRLLEAARVVGLIENAPIGDFPVPTSEGQIRPLTNKKLDDPRVVSMWIGEIEDIRAAGEDRPPTQKELAHRVKVFLSGSEDEIAHDEAKLLAGRLMKQFRKLAETFPIIAANAVSELYAELGGAE